VVANPSPKKSPAAFAPTEQFSCKIPLQKVFGLSVENILRQGKMSTEKTKETIDDSMTLSKKISTSFCTFCLYKKLTNLYKIKKEKLQ
jgi:hypothetical protein